MFFTDARHFTFFNLLHAVILPPRLSKHHKPTISDAQHDMIIHIANINDLQQKLDEITSAAYKEKSSIQAKVIAVGDTPENLTEFYIFLDGFKYKVPTLLAAIDSSVKCSYVFNLEYSPKSKYVWIFLQDYVYELPTKDKIPKIQNIIAKLKKHE